MKYSKATTKQNTVNKNIGISTARVVAMLSIIMCHLFNESGSFSFLGQFFNVGVHVFIFISALLYGQKHIGDAKEWLLKRGKKILVPFYIYMIFLFTVRFVLYGTFEWKSYIIYALNLQRFTDSVTGANHLWFLTLIMFCYLVTPLLNKGKATVKQMSKWSRAVVVVTLLLAHVFVAYTFSGVITHFYFYILAYAVVYYYSYLQGWAFDNKKQIVALTACMIMGGALRLVARSMVDGTVLYDFIVVSYTQAILGMWILVMCLKMKPVVVKLHLERVVAYLDGISFEIYIMHYMFCVGPFRIMSLTESFVLNSVIVIVLSYVGAVILKKLAGLVVGSK